MEDIGYPDYEPCGIWYFASLFDNKLDHYNVSVLLQENEDVAELMLEVITTKYLTAADAEMHRSCKYRSIFQRLNIDVVCMVSYMHKVLND